MFASYKPASRFTIEQRRSRWKISPVHPHCTRTAPALHPHCTRTAPALHPHCTLIAPSSQPLGYRLSCCSLVFASYKPASLITIEQRRSRWKISLITIEQRRSRWKISPITIEQRRSRWKISLITIEQRRSRWKISPVHPQAPTSIRGPILLLLQNSRYFTQI